MVVPAILDLYNGVNRQLDSVRYLRRMLHALRDSLMTRFLGVFVRVRMGTAVNPSKQPFHNRVYMCAALLDPNLKLNWIDMEVEVLSDNIDLDVDDMESAEVKKDIKKEIQGSI